MFTAHKQTIAQMIVQQLRSPVDVHQAGVNEIATVEVSALILTTVHFATSNVILSKSGARRPEIYIGRTDST